MPSQDHDGDGDVATPVPDEEGAGLPESEAETTSDQMVHTPQTAE